MFKFYTKLSNSEKKNMMISVTWTVTFWTAFCKSALRILETISKDFFPKLHSESHTKSLWNFKTMFLEVTKVFLRNSAWILFSIIWKFVLLCNVCNVCKIRQKKYLNTSNISNSIECLRNASWLFWWTLKELSRNASRISFWDLQKISSNFSNISFGILQ